MGAFLTRTYTHYVTLHTHAQAYSHSDVMPATHTHPAADEAGRAGCKGSRVARAKVSRRSTATPDPGERSYARRRFLPTLAKVSLGARDACSCVVVLELRAQVPPESVLTELYPGGRRDVPALCVHARIHVASRTPGAVGNTAAVKAGLRKTGRRRQWALCARCRR